MEDLRAEDFLADDFLAEDFRPEDFLAEDLRPEDFRADVFRADVLRDEERFRAVDFRPPDFRALDLRPLDLRALDLRAPERELLFFAREPPRDDFLAAMPVLRVGGFGEWISKIRAQCRSVRASERHEGDENDSPGRRITQFSAGSPDVCQAYFNLLGGSSTGSSVNTNVPQCDGINTHRLSAFTLRIAV